MRRQPIYEGVGENLRQHIETLRLLEHKRHTSHCRNQHHLTQTMRQVTSDIAEMLDEHPAPEVLNGFSVAS